MSSRKIPAFDGGSSDESDEQNTTVVSTRSQKKSTKTPTRRHIVSTPKTTPRRTTQTPRSIAVSIVDSPEPGPSRRNVETTPQRRKSIPRRKQVHPLRRKNMKMIREMYKLQTTTKLLIPKAPFARLVKEIIQGFNRDMRLQTFALEALQEATEMYVTQFFGDVYKCTLHRRAVTLNPADCVLLRYLRRNYMS